MYLGDYRLATEEFWNTGFEQADVGELPRCFHWKRHLEIFAMACRLGIEFCRMQEEALWMFGNLVREFANLDLRSSGYAQAWKVVAMRTWREDAREMLDVHCWMGLEQFEQKEAAKRLTRCIEDFYGLRVREDGGL